MKWSATIKQSCKVDTGEWNVVLIIQINELLLTISQEQRTRNHYDLKDFRTTPFPDTKIMRDTWPTSNMLQPRTYDWNNAELEDIQKRWHVGKPSVLMKY